MNKTLFLAMNVNVTRTSPFTITFRTRQSKSGSFCFINSFQRPHTPSPDRKEIKSIFQSSWSNSINWPFLHAQRVLFQSPH